MKRTVMVAGALIGVLATYSLVVRRWHLRWGATDGEVLEALPGDDLIADYSGVKVVVDPSSAQLLAGATLDYSDGLQGAGFAIDNPNAQKTCGCGNSFS